MRSKFTSLLFILIICGLLLPPAHRAEGAARFPGLVDSLRAEIGDRRMGVYVIPLDNPADAFGINPDAQVPAASAWKGGGLIYFFEYAPAEMVNSMPVEDWVHTDPTRVPRQYQKAVIQYGYILHDAYIMTVFSGNHEAGNVLAYVYRQLPDPKPKNPIVAFNNWGLSIGMTPESGMRMWMAGGTWSPAYRDSRYEHRQFFPGDKVPLYDQTYSARDFAQFFYHLATVGKQKGYYDQAAALLEIRNKVVSLIEACPESALSTGMVTVTKDGYFRPDSGPEAHGHDVDNDAGLLVFPDGRTYVVAFTAFDSRDVSHDVVCKTIHAIVLDHGSQTTF
ncbi:MAG TPA: hypothetical protein VMT34_04560 [Aggregatilineales bacterium]|nr:hypothetical protein [Aggregatilineales bacterium]